MRMFSPPKRLAALSPRTRRLLGTTVASYLARGVSAAVLLLTIPLARRLLEPELFGLWMMLGALLSFLAFADLGIGNGLMNRVSQAVHRGNHEEAARTTVAAYFSTLACGLALGTAWFAWLLLADEPLRFAGAIPTAHVGQAAAAFSTLVVLVALSLPVQVTQKLQLVAQDGHWVGLSQLAAATGTLVLLPLGLWLELPLAALLLCTFGLQVGVGAATGVYWLVVRQQLPGLRAAPLQRQAVSALLRTGSLFFVLQLCAAFAFQSDAFVISQLLGPAAYGDFAAVQRLFLSVTMLVSASMVGLWPAFSDALARNDLPWARRAFARSLGLGVAVMSLLCAAITVAMPWIGQHWLAMTTAIPLALLLTLSGWTVLETLGQISGTLLNGAGIIRAQVGVAIVVAVASFAAKWWLVAQVGAWGAVLASIVAYSVVSVPCQVWLLRRVLSPATLAPG
ncbi:MAG TPA: oligosaccharide flippase family protein [Rubrivivax sp.]|nr:oligosaccharide flippase family protein [Rubrivivax sp.]